MTDVNLNGPTLKLVRTGGQGRDRIPVAPQHDGVARGGHALTGSATTKDIAASQRIAAQQQALSPFRSQGQSQEKQLDQAVSQLNDYVQSVQRDLQFEVDNESGRTIVRVVDQATQEVVRQIPDELALKLAENLQHDEPLTLFNIEV